MRSAPWVTMHNFHARTGCGGLPLSCISLLQWEDEKEFAPDEDGILEADYGCNKYPLQHGALRAWYNENDEEEDDAEDEDNIVWMKMADWRLAVKYVTAEVPELQKFTKRDIEHFPFLLGNSLPAKSLPLAST